MKKRRRTYRDEFRSEAIDLVKSGISYAQAERDLGISSGIISRWERKLNRPLAEKESSNELKFLKKENERLRRERDILKKAMAIFSKDQ